jgi:glycosyltransferase involved in cell wall biosynthesis
MSTLRVMIDAVIDGAPRGVARYSEELTRALIEHAPSGAEVEAIVPASPPERIAEIEQTFPGLTGIHRTALGRRELRAAWRFGLTTVTPGGMIHSPTPLAPLVPHDRRDNPGEQTVVTIHSSAPWVLRDSGDSQAGWVRHMAKRAHKYADAVVVPTHAVADSLSEHLDFGDRIRVIGGAVSPRLALPDDPDAAALRLGLPSDYVLAIGTLDPRKNLEALFRAAAAPAFPDIQLLVIGEETRGPRTMSAAVFESGAPQGRIVTLEPLSDSDLAVVLDRATAFVLPSLYEGSGLTAVEAMHFGTPVIHTDTPALAEVVAGAGVGVELAGDDFSERLAAAVAATLEDSELLAHLSVEGLDRSKAYSWRDSAERVWQLHADL